MDVNRIETKNLANILEFVLCKQDQVSCPVQHHFGPGIYIREVTVPKGTFTIGHKQTHEHLNVFLRGKVNMINNDGSSYTIEAPMIFTSPPGRKVGYVLETMTWLNIYPTEERDIAILESIYLDKSDIWTEAQVAPLQREADRLDFDAFLNEYNLDADVVRSQSENTEDYMYNFPNGTYNVMVSDSEIEGKGLFATADIPNEDIITIALYNGMRTPAGRYTNHSVNPNAEMIKYPNGDIYLKAIKPICGYRGGILGDEITVNYRQVLAMHKGV